MSSLTASLVALLLTVMCVLPVAWAAWDRNAYRSGIALAVAIAAFCFLQTGLLSPPTLPSRAEVLGAAAPVDSQQCTEIRETMQKAGLDVEENSDGTLRLIGPGAATIPPDLQATLVACAKEPETYQDPDNR